jgi:hypothetical protein
VLYFYAFFTKVSDECIAFRSTPLQKVCLRITVVFRTKQKRNNNLDSRNELYRIATTRKKMPFFCHQDVDINEKIFCCKKAHMQQITNRILTISITQVVSRV